jgi:hypothetical protein
LARFRARLARIITFETVKTLGLAVLPVLLTRADELIE